RRRHTRSYGDWSSDVCSSDLTVVITAWFGTSRFGVRAGLAAAVMLAATPFFYLIGRLGILDMPLTFFLTLAIVALHRAMDHGERSEERRVGKEWRCRWEGE